MARLDWSDAGNILARCHIDRDADYHELRFDRVADLVAEGKAVGYRKPRNANGSYGRYFHAHLMRALARRDRD